MYHPRAPLSGGVNISQLDAAKTSLLCGHQVCLQERQSGDKNHDGLMVAKPVAPRPNSKYVGLDLT